MATQGPMTGRVFSGRYQINDRIGIGGMAEVYRAQDNVLGRSVAVKVMLPQYAADPDFTRRFRQEAAAAANLQSPYIVNVYDWGQDDDTYFIVMEFVRGSDLKTAIQQRGAINQRKAAEIGSQVCQALTVAHNQDIIHRDIKPQNIMVQPDGNAKVMDFGIARAKNSVSDKTSSVLGTAHYISPEQAQGKELTAASDIYSLGIVLYEATTGKLPFDGPDAVGVALKQVKEYPPAPSEINPDIDPALEDIILTALEKDPADRFATANDMRLALNDYLAGRAVAIAGGRNSFTEAQTRVIGPAAAGGAIPVDATQTMPAVGGANGYGGNAGAGYGGSTSYRAEPPKKSKRGVVIALVAVLAIALVAGVAYAFMSGNGDKGTPVPNVVGMTYEQAAETLEAAGFEVGAPSYTYDASVEEGLVISQSPKAEDSKPAGTKITLTISQGTEQITVPDLRGCTLEQAKSKVGSNFTINYTGSQNSSEYAKDQIMIQSPAAGDKAEKGSTIDYVMSLGPEDITVPNVIGYGESGATSALQDAGLKVSTEYAYSDDAPAGLVTAQTLSAGSKVEHGAAITITVSKGEDPAKKKPDPEPSSSSSASSSASSAASSASSSASAAANARSGSAADKS